jgi:hypothetical protein
LKRMYGKNIPPESQRIVDVFRSQEEQLVCVGFGHIFVISRSDLLLDKSNLRWVFNRQSMINSKVSLTDSFWLYIDARVLDDVFVPELLREVERLCGQPKNRRLLRDVMARGSRILDCLAVLSFSLRDPFKSITSSVQLYTAFSAVREVDRPGHSGLEMIEYVLRSREEEAQISRLIGGMSSPVPRLDYRNFGLGKMAVFGSPATKVTQLVETAIATLSPFSTTQP